MSASHFADSYAEARRRFREAAAAAGATLTSYRIDADADEDLTVDVAILGTNGAPTIVTSSGIHGVEGFLGSAVQLALLQRLAHSDPPPGIRHALLHAVNPFGFSQLRRPNEDNVDLNRNFLDDPSAYKGAPNAYAELNGFLNPESPPTPWEPFALKASWAILRYGMQAITQAVAGGQYEYPHGIFFGGKGPCRSTLVVIDHCDSWIGSSEQVVHLDFHSGLGRFGEYKLLLAERTDPESLRWYIEAFGSGCVEALGTPNATAYEASGLFGGWMQRRFGSHRYRFVTAEFGTYGPIRVLGAIRAENRAHHYGSAASPRSQAAKAELLECFCPRSAAWRKQVVASSLRLIDQATEALRSAP